VRSLVNIRIPVAQPYIDQEDVNSILDALKHKRLSQGVYVDNFEKKFAAHMKCRNAIAVMNGTAALHLSVLALGIKPGDEVIVPSFSFIATANCVLYVGAKPVFVDINSRTFNIDPEKIAKKITSKTRAIIPVHYGGQCADMKPILEIAEDNNLKVIEDAAEAHGATYMNKIAGVMGDVGCFSFYPNKNMTTGEGGMVVTNDDKIAERIRLLRNHGQDSRYHHVITGYNYRMTDLQAALGISQLKKINWFTHKKIEVANYYNKLLSNNVEIEIPYHMENVSHTYMLYTIKFRKKNWRDKIKEHLHLKGIETRIAFPPIHLQPIYKSLYEYKKGYLLVTEECAKKVLSIPIYTHIKRDIQKFVTETILEGLQEMITK